MGKPLLFPFQYIAWVDVKLEERFLEIVNDFPNS